MEKTSVVEEPEQEPAKPDGIGHKVIEALEHFLIGHKGTPDAEYEARRNEILSRSHPLFPEQRELVSADLTTFGPEQYRAAKELEATFTQVATGNRDGGVVDIKDVTPEQVDTIREILNTTAEIARRTSRILLLQVGSHERDLYVDDKKAEDQQLKSFDKQLQYYLCRAVVTVTQEGSTPLETLVNNRDYLVSMLGEVPQLVEDVYKTDIPLYDKVLEEFDEMREENPDMLEVYLSRDGIFAYTARRAQAAARGQGARQNKEDQSEKRIVKPKYKNLLINRKMVGTHDDYDIDDSDYTPEQRRMIETTVRTYAQQSGLEGEDVHFFDTGYVGSIPEELLLSLGFKGEEISKRIHLISAEDRERRSEGLWFNRSGAVDEIEHERPQATRSAKGFRGEGGKLIPVVERSSAHDVFLHQVIKHVIHRHFFYREKRDDN